MSALARRSEALPTLEKARALLAAARDIDSVRKIKAVAEAVRHARRGHELACDAGEIVVWAERRMAEIERDEIEDRKERAKKGRPKKGKNVLTLSRAKRQQQLYRARLLKLLEHELAAYFKAQRKSLEPPTVHGAIQLANVSSAAQRERIIRRVAQTKNVATAARETKRDDLKAHLEDVATKEAKAASGVFDVVVVDPPWPIEKMELDARPNHVGLDYPAMSLDEIEAMEIPCADDCHVWLWTTHRFLHDAFALLGAWGLKYVCTFVWHKSNGYQPVGLPKYNCEFALYARRGSPKFLDLKAFNVCFDAPSPKRGHHSEKPDAFYDLVRRVTAGRRLDMFNRRVIAGFDGWGKEAPNAAE